MAGERQRRFETDGLSVDRDRHGPRGVDLELAGLPHLPAARQPPDHQDAEAALIDAWPGAAAKAAVESVGVVRHQHHDRRLVLDPPLVDDPQTVGHAFRRALGARRVEQCAQLGSPVAGVLDGIAVDAEGSVVDEDTLVDGGQVDPRLDPLGEGVQCPHDVVAAHPEVEREMVPRTGGDADERQLVLGGDRRHDRLRTVAARHARARRHPGRSRPGQARRGRRRDPGSPPRCRACVPPRPVRRVPPGRRRSAG